MPELPEVETIKLQLAKYIVGKRIHDIKAFHPTSVLGKVTEIKSRRVEKVDRRGKLLIIELEGGIVIAIHLKMSGQLLLVHSSQFVVHRNGNTTSSKYTRAVIELENDDRLYFNDQRKFGWIEVSHQSSAISSQMGKYIKNLGPEIWDSDDREFHRRIIHSKRPIKLVLLDQTVIAGIGNIYANDALWEARIHPERRADELRYEDTKLLKRSLINVLEEGIKYGGATGKDLKYKNIFGKSGTYQEHFRVYEQTGRKCKRNDGGVVTKIRLGGRGTYFCPVCQR